LFSGRSRTKKLVLACILARPSSLFGRNPSIGAFDSSAAAKRKDFHRSISPR
jgi:hypothetical protein